jgi:hypothetical protein
MTISFRRWLPALVLALTALVVGASARERPKPQEATKPAEAAQPKAAPRPPEPTLTVDQMKAFLLNAEIVASRGTPKGITSPYRLTLKDGTLTHEAGFQAIDERSSRRDFADGTVELNFVDSYHYDIAACELATLLGLGEMMPVTVERTWQGKIGALKRVKTQGEKAVLFDKRPQRVN